MPKKEEEKKDMTVKNVPVSVRKAFRFHCFKIGRSMNEVLIEFMKKKAGEK